MSNQVERPREIQLLIEWLREPGRKLAHGTLEDRSGRQCAVAKLYEIAGIESGITRLSAKVGLDFDTDDQPLIKLIRVNDANHKNPAAVAAYLETQFPQAQ